MEVGHLTVFVAPACVLRLDGDDATFHVVHIVLILLQGHRDDSDIDLLVNALRLQAVLQDVACGVGDIVGDLHGLRYGLDGLYRLRCIEVAHDETEKPEEQEEHSQTEEHDAHGKQGDTEAVGILALQFGIFRLISLDEVLDAWCYVLSRLHVPLCCPLTGITLVSSQRRDCDGVDEFLGITVIESEPKGFRHGNLK